LTGDHVLCLHDCTGGAGTEAEALLQQSVTAHDSCAHEGMIDLDISLLHHINEFLIHVLI